MSDSPPAYAAYHSWIYIISYRYDVNLGAVLFVSAQTLRPNASQRISAGKRRYVAMGPHSVLILLYICTQWQLVVLEGQGASWFTLALFVVSEKPPDNSHTFLDCTKATR